MKWYTKRQYVDLQTGEIIGKQEAEKYYIITKKINDEKTKQYNWSRPSYNGTRTREEYNIRTITYGCTRNGKQTRFWEDT